MEMTQKSRKLWRGTMTKDFPIVSVVMPVYNTPEEYLREAIESILKQTFSNFEFVIIDDGSTDRNVKKVIQSYQDKRIAYYYKENAGVANALNYGIKKATGTYIARMDSDDISLPERLEKQVAFLDAHPDISLVGALYERFPEYCIPHLPQTVGLIDMLKWCPVAHPLVMFRKKDFESRHLFYDPAYRTEDYELWGRALLAGLKFANIQEVLLKYRWHASNVSNQKKAEMDKDTQRVKDQIIQALSGEFEIQKKLARLLEPTEISCNQKVYFCGIKLLVIKQKGFTKKYYLFGAIPFLKIKEKKA